MDAHNDSAEPERRADAAHVASSFPRGVAVATFGAGAAARLALADDPTADDTGHLLPRVADRAVVVGEPIAPHQGANAAGARRVGC